jgi:Brp/Blh family beta-carotene 15,15'-monooxygenase
VTSGSRSLVLGADGGAVDAPPSASFLFNGLALVALAVSLFVGFCGIDLGQQAATLPSCAAILLFGLPHGTLDLELLRGGRRGKCLPLPLLIALYIGFAWMTYVVWLASSTLALIAFLAISVIHFAEDWRAGTTSFLAHAMAVATLTAPALLHRDAVMVLFVTLTGQSDAALLAQLLLLVAPVALLAGCVGCADLWRNGHVTLAVSGAIMLMALLLLPPLIGFTIYFCVLHSPAQLRRNIRFALDLSAGRRLKKLKTALIIVSLTLAALGIVALLFTLQADLNTGDGFMTATFMTLSILTIPHMLMPMIVELIPRHSRHMPTLHKLRNIT